MAYIKESELYLQASMRKTFAYELLSKASSKEVDKSYFDEYWRIVQSKEVLSEGYEDHHIILQAYQRDGSCSIDIHSIENLCRLSYKNHFLAHWYLWKAVRDIKTALAAKLLHGLNKRLSRISDVDITAEEYSKLKEACWSDPKDRKNHSDLLKRYYRANPEAIIALSARNKEYFSNPQNKEKQSRIILQYHKEHPEFSKLHSDMMKKRFKENPSLIKEHKEKLEIYYRNPENRENVSRSLKKYYQENPEYRKENSERIKEIWKDPYFRLKLSGRNCKPIICINTGVEYISATEAGRILDTHRDKFLKQARGQRTSPWCGLLFRFASEQESVIIKKEYIESKGREINNVKSYK